jgi:hypothetical protein
MGITLRFYDGQSQRRLTSTGGRTSKANKVYSSSYAITHFASCVYRLYRVLNRGIRDISTGQHPPSITLNSYPSRFSILRHCLLSATLVVLDEHLVEAEVQQVFGNLHRALRILPNKLARRLVEQLVDFL